MYIYREARATNSNYTIPPTRFI